MQPVHRSDSSHLYVSLNHLLWESLNIELQKECLWACTFRINFHSPNWMQCDLWYVERRVWLTSMKEIHWWRGDWWIFWAGVTRIGRCCYPDRTFYEPSQNRNNMTSIFMTEWDWNTHVRIFTYSSLVEEGYELILGVNQLLQVYYSPRHSNTRKQRSLLIDKSNKWKSSSLKPNDHFTYTSQS